MQNLQDLKDFSVGLLHDWRVTEVINPMYAFGDFVSESILVFTVYIKSIFVKFSFTLKSNLFIHEICGSGHFPEVNQLRKMLWHIK